MAAFDGTQLRLEDVAEGAEYKAFVEKFKPRKTTDDCYTPENIYEAVAGWVCDEYGVAREDMVRPFWPGGDYEREEYPDGCCVVDNPPFSILAQIMDFYSRRHVRFFLFAPTLTLLAGRRRDTCYIAVGAKITYANGADVNTSFVSSLDDAQLRSAPELYRRVRVQNDINERAAHKELPKYSYPDEVLTAAAAYHYSQYGIDYRLAREDCIFIPAMDAQRGAGKSIFGGGLLLSERAAAERAAAERAAAERAAATRWKLSERELEIVRHLGGDGHG